MGSDEAMGRGLGIPLAVEHLVPRLRWQADKHSCFALLFLRELMMLRPAQSAHAELDARTQHQEYQDS